MPKTPEPQSKPAPQPRYLWPWFVAAAVLLGVLLSVLWMSREIERTRQLRQGNAPGMTTNAGPLRP